MQTIGISHQFFSFVYVVFLEIFTFMANLVCKLLLLVLLYYIVMCSKIISLFARGSLIFVFCVLFGKRKFGS